MTKQIATSNNDQNDQLDKLKNTTVNESLMFQDEEIKEQVKTNKSGLLVYTATELLTEFEGTETDFLWDNLIPRVGTGLLVGQPDLGKSQLAKELAIMIAKGSSEHLGMKLKPIHNHVLYVFTEDQEEGVSSSLHKQLIKHSDLDKSKLSLAFLRDESIAELIQKLDAFCTLTSVDLVVIDAFGDIFSGSDSNNNIQMRRDIKAFDNIVRKHKISVLFVHHINKSGYGKNPSQELIQGGSGLTQKVRFALFLSRNDDGQKFLNVAKGNYSSKFYKENRLPVELDEDTLTFEVNGEWEPLDKSTKKQKSDLNDDDLFMIFKNNGLSFNQVCAKIIDCLNVSQSTAERRIVKLVNKGRITKVDKLYYRNDFVETTTLASKTLEKNEGEGKFSDLDLFQMNESDEDNLTINNQTPVNDEGDGSDYFPFENTLTSSDTLVAEGEGWLIDNEDDPFQKSHITENDSYKSWADKLDDVVCYDDSSQAFVVKNQGSIDPIFEKMNDLIEESQFWEDVEYYDVAYDFYVNGLFEIGKAPIQLSLLVDFLCDQYTLSDFQSKYLIEIFIKLKKIRINEFDYVEIIK